MTVVGVPVERGVRLSRPLADTERRSRLVRVDTHVSVIYVGVASVATRSGSWDIYMYYVRIYIAIKTQLRLKRSSVFRITV